jgi:hypothetical protein
LPEHNKSGERAILLFGISAINLVSANVDRNDPAPLDRAASAGTAHGTKM